MTPFEVEYTADSEYRFIGSDGCGQQLHDDNYVFLAFVSTSRLFTSRSVTKTQLPVKKAFVV